MKTYKLIKKYPVSLELGTEVTWGEYGLSGSCYQVKVKAGIFRFDKDTIENNPEFWQEVEQPDYEILEVKLSDDTILTYKGQECIKRTDVFTPGNTFKLDACLKDSRVKINSVKRLSDGLVIKVGNRVTTKGYMTTETVTGFDICDGTTPFKKGLWVRTGEEGTMYIERVKEVLKPKYITYDGVEVYSYSQKVHWVINGKYEYALDMCYANVELVNTEPKTYKVFSTFEAAKEYVNNLQVEMKRPCLSIEDCLNIKEEWHSNRLSLEESLKEYIKKK